MYQEQKFGVFYLNTKPSVKWSITISLFGSNFSFKAAKITKKFAALSTTFLETSLCVKNFQTENIYISTNHISPHKN